MTLEEKVKRVIRSVPDFPKKGIDFKDITPLLANPKLMSEILDFWISRYKNRGIDLVIGIESRGFFLGTALAERLQVPFVPVRKKGKLPAETISCSYDLEYGRATVEMHADAVHQNDKVLIHDDLLATGGTAAAARELCKQQGAEVTGYCFLIELLFLNGRKKLGLPDELINSLVQYE